MSSAFISYDAMSENPDLNFNATLTLWRLCLHMETFDFEIFAVSSYALVTNTNLYEDRSVKNALPKFQRML